MIHDNIQGWFDYDDFYDWILLQYKTVVEIGAWKGKSAAYMGEMIMRREIDMEYTVIDHFKGNSNSILHKTDDDIINRRLYQIFIKNIEPVKNYVNVIVGNSHKVYNRFEDKSIDVLFIDGGHTYKEVKRDIMLWKPKVKHIIAGHDYYMLGVNKAVNECLPDHTVFSRNTWIKRLS